MNSDLSPGDNGPFRDKLYKTRLLNLVKELGVRGGGVSMVTVKPASLVLWPGLARPAKQTFTLDYEGDTPICQGMGAVSTPGYVHSNKKLIHKLIKIRSGQE